MPENLQQDEHQGIIALTSEQVIWGLERKPTLADLLDEDATLVAGGETIDTKTRLYPIGTALALARLLRSVGSSELLPRREAVSLYSR